MEGRSVYPMISEDLIRLMHEERERQIEVDLRVRRLLGGRRAFIHWRPRRRPLHGDPGLRDR